MLLKTELLTLEYILFSPVLISSGLPWIMPVVWVQL